MTKIEEIINKAKDQNVSVSALLREAKVIATKLDQAEFLSWINLELTGYKDDSPYPDYRSLQGQIKAWNPFYGWVPVLVSNSAIEEKLSLRQTNQSISEIEELLSEKARTYEMPFPASIADKLLRDSIKMKVSLFIDRSSLVGILSAVRDNILDWAIKLNNQGIKGEDEILTIAEKEKVQQIESKYNIGNIEYFHGNVGEGSEYTGKIQSPRETFWSKAFWYIFIALAVVVIGNILSALILKYLFGLK